jgi:hypothetical protein
MAHSRLESRRRAWSAAAALAIFVTVAGVSGLALSGCSEDTKLKVTGIDPKKGDFNGGQLVRITGNRFQAEGVRSAKVYFGARQANVIRFNGDHELIVQAPGGDVGQTVDVLVIFEPGGELRIPKAFTFIEPGTGADLDDLDTSGPRK